MREGGEGRGSPRGRAGGRRGTGGGSARPAPPRPYRTIWRRARPAPPTLPEDLEEREARPPRPYRTIWRSARPALPTLPEDLAEGEARPPDLTGGSGGERASPPPAPVRAQGGPDWPRLAPPPT